MSALRPATAPFWRRLPVWVGVLAVLFGLMVLAGWQEHWPAVIQFAPTWAPVKANTAVGFMLCGLALIGMARKRVALAVPLAGLVVLIGGLTLMEYVLGKNLGIDEVFFKDYIRTATAFPGRMSPLTASCFVFAGSALVFALVTKRAWRLAPTGLLGCIVMVIAFVAAFGYLLGIKAAYGWGAYTRMALPTSLIFFLVGGALFVWSWRRSMIEGFNFLRWVPISGSVTLLMMVGIVSVASLVGLKNTIFFREAAYRNINLAGSISGSLADLQRGMRSYMLTGDPAALEKYRAGTNAIAGQVADLDRFAIELHRQQRRVRHINTDVAAFIACARGLMATNAAGDATLAVQMEKDGTALELADRTAADLNAFTKDEQASLNNRDLVVADDFYNTTRLLIFGCVLAGGLLVLAHFMAGREVRRRAESQKRLAVSLKEIGQLKLAMDEHAIVSITDQHGIITYANDRFCAISKYSPDELVGQNHRIVNSGHHPAEFFRDMWSTIGSGKVWHGEIKNRAKDGSHYWVDATITPFMGDDGRPRQYVAIRTDITAIKTAQESLNLSEERFRQAFDGAAIGMSLVLLNGRFLKVNRAFCEMLGYTEEELLQTDFQNITHPDDLAQDLAQVGDVLAGKIAQYQMEKRYFCKNGSLIYVLLSVSLVRDPAGGPLYFVSQVENITERKLAGESLRQSEERFRLIVEGVNDYAIFMLDPEGRIASWNAGAERIKGYKAEEIIGRHFSTFYPPEALADRKPERIIAEALAYGFVRDEGERVRKDGSRFFANVLITALRDEHGHLRGFSKVTRDITEMRQTQERMRMSEERFRSAFDDAPIGMALVSPPGRWLRANRTLCEMIGYTEEELLQIDFQRVTHPDDLEKDLQLVWKVLTGKIFSYQIEKRYIHKNGSHISVNLSVSLVRDAQGKPHYFVAQIENITQRKKAEAEREKLMEEVASNEALLRQFIVHTPAAIAVLDTEMRYLQVSERWLKDFRLEGRDLIGRSHYEMFPDLPERWKEGHRRALAGELQKCDEDQGRMRPDGSFDWLQWELRPWRRPDGTVGGVIFFIQIITERKRAEQKIADSLRDKEALLREVHHRVKNNMQVISSILQLQTGYIKDAASLEIFKDCQNRIRTMALIHEKLYRSEGLAQIDFKEYLENLVGLLLRSQTSRGVVLRHELQVERIMLAVDTAIPLGLIANELVSNCFKHAFTGQTRGTVRVQLQRCNGHGFELVVQDDGKGLPAGFDPEKTSSLGVRLVRILSGQIKGAARFENDGGTKISITFGAGTPAHN